MFRIALAAGLVLALLAPVTPAQDGQPGADPGPAPAGATKDRKDLAVKGEKVEIRIRPGIVLTGVVRNRQYEVLRGKHWAPAESGEEPGAGLRLYYAMGLNGYIFIRNDAILELRFLGELTQAELEEIVRGIVEAEERALRERAKAAAERAAREAAKHGEQPAEPEEGEPAAGGPAEEADPLASLPTGADVDPDRADRIRSLLKRFPPGKWKPETYAELRRRTVIMGIYPDDEERAFLENFELWREGYELLKKAEEAVAEEEEPEE